MVRTRVKICGFTRREDVEAAVRIGVDAIGLNFHEPSPRFVEPAQALALLRVIPPFVASVGLLVDAPAQRVSSLLEQLSLAMLQFHGDEAEADCVRHGRPWIKALRMRDDLDVAEAFRAWPSAAGLLLDAYRPGVPGGTGETFDWSRIPARHERPVVLAGGLSPENVEEAIVAVRPHAVDVAGGVESAPGIKDRVRMEAFMAAVQRADARIAEESARTKQGFAGANGGHRSLGHE